VFRDSLNETLISVQWIIIIYHAARSGTGFIAGHLADTVGLKRVLLFGIVLYTLSVAIISLQGSLAPVVGMRVPQGIGVAILFTVGPAIVAKAFGPERRGTALGVTLGAVGAGQMAGTLGGGWLSLNIGWEAIFWARVPVGVATFVLVYVGVREVRRTGSPFSWSTAMSVFVFLFVLVLALSFARIDGWFSVRPALLYVGSAISLGFVVWRHRASLNPVFPVSVLRVMEVRAGVISNLVVTTGTFVMWFLFPFFVVDVMGRSALVLGVLLATMAGASLVGSAAGGWIADRVGDRKSTLAGTAIAAVGLWFVGGMTGASEMTVMIGAVAITGLGFGGHQAAVYALTLRRTESRHAGAASAALAVAQTIGTVLSIAVLTSLLAWQESRSESISDVGQFLDAYSIVLPVAAIITLAGGLVALVTFGGRRKVAKDGTAAA
jgi:MFS family permease